MSKMSELMDFPENWLPIGGNLASNWNFNQDSQDQFCLEISNSGSNRAGIIQTENNCLEVRGNKRWFICGVYQSEYPNVKAYVRLYPIFANGDVPLPWMFCFNSRSKTGKTFEFRHFINIDPKIVALRLETGIIGSGQLIISKLIAYPMIPRHYRGIYKVEPVKQVDHIHSIGEILKPVRLAAPIPLNIPVNVQARVDSDIRNLTSQRDRVQIYGSSHVPLATTGTGRVQAEISGHGFQESIEEAEVGQTISYSTIRDVSALSRYSFAVYNRGSQPANVQVELSPDGLHWLKVGKRERVEPETLIMIPPQEFLRYTRVSCEAEGLTTLRIWVQAQN
ncbi:hypothetical protein Desaci_0594 [Desulfosporosinus acidiphilus SJ4]|uniref:DUF6385 domain-containing protein n=1 Tax=Desulfosporosinus acidiphilus (strain DSM 22704 / JCM 16185 / SJ4) TaxID=646529 RepID=I4D1I2_DESAJ|nr:DUF6385 domain-containing protein [Desulfosporosinus acidiphilus]AFM39656.1 hypothetical protein Desaci_0594 [Desulfosporosinus acidiphilus SJ4]